MAGSIRNQIDAVRTDHTLGVLQDLLHVLFTHGEAAFGYTSMILLQKIHHRIERINAHLLTHLRVGHAHSPGSVLSPNDQEVLQTHIVHAVIPAGIVDLKDLLADLLHDCRILQHLGKGLRALVQELGRDGGKGRGGSGHIGVGIQRNIQSLFQGLVDHRKGFSAALPKNFAHTFKVGDIYRDLALSGNVDALCHRVKQTHGLGTGVRGVNAAVLTGDRTQTGQLFGITVDTGHIRKARGDTQRTILHTLGNIPLHMLQFFFCGMAGLQAHCVTTNTAVTHEINLVGAQRQITRCFNLFPEGSKNILVGRQKFPYLLRLVRGKGRRGLAALTADLRSTAHTQYMESVGVIKNGIVRMGVGIDEAGSQAKTLGIHHRCSRSQILPADRCDLISIYRHIAAKGCGTAAIINQCIPNNQIIHGSFPPVCKFLVPVGR